MASSSEQTESLNEEPIIRRYKWMYDMHGRLICFPIYKKTEQLTFVNYMQIVLQGLTINHTYIDSAKMIEKERRRRKRAGIRTLYRPFLYFH